ncbi:dihydropyrimidinase [Fonticella tunisiensis]|uniref:Dihydropyrimidinase n=1 Tax=Fonticella tunisiensis TaxID=1096341 RepID=A0A4R7KXC9_9CLOT|nr:dihydropyrimidinase [Fonticella tunisiensis]TDT63670.1 dihydropyrimidinase [Fonticella tunisiensis]
MRTVIKNGRIVTASDDFEGDIYIEDGIIREIGVGLKKDSDILVDAKGKIVVPGGVDAHTHFNLHTGSAAARDDFYTGTVAAACGGTTCIIDHMGFGPSGCRLDHQLNVYHGYAKGNAVVDYSFHGVVQHVDESILNQLIEMISFHGIPSFKIYMTYDYRVKDDDALRFMERLKGLGGITAVHAENHEIINYLRYRFVKEGKTSPLYHALSRPKECEGEAINRIIEIAKMAGDAPLYIVHLTTSVGLKYIEEARDCGQSVYAETCPQYLLLSEEKYREDNNEGLKYIMSPPLRSKGDNESLWNGIQRGYIQVIATDHCPFHFETDKQLGRDDFTKCPNGAPGVEERMPLIFSEGVVKGRISINKFVEVCCTNPAKIFGLYPKKGTIAPGSDGDIVIIDPDRRVKLTQGILHSNVDYTAYEGFELKGYPVMTISRGEIIAKDYEFVGEKGRGRFIKRKTVFNNKHFCL